MKPKHILPLALSCIAWTGLASSAELTWDTSTDPGIQGGTGSWDTTLANWTTDGGGANAAWNNTTNASDTAVFTTGNGRVGIPGAIALGGIRVTSPDGATLGGRTAMTYVFEGAGSLDFGSQRGLIDTFESGLLGIQIGNDLVGTGGLEVNAANAPQTGNGWVYLSGDNSGLSGGIEVRNGMIGVPSQAALGGNSITFDGNAGLLGPINTAGPEAAAIVGPATLTLDNAITILGTDNVLRIWGGRTVNLDGTLSGDGLAARSDGGVLNLNGDNSGFAGTIVNAAAVTNINGAFGGTIETNAGTVNLNQPFAGELFTLGGVTNVNAGFTGAATHDGGTLNILAGTFAASVAYADNGTLVIGPDAVVAGDVSAEFGASALTVAGEITGDLFVDDSITTTLAGSVVGGGLTTGFDNISDITIQQADGPISIGGTLKVIGRLSIAQDGSIPFGQDILTFDSLVTDSANPLDDVQVAGISSFRGGQTLITANSIQATATPGAVVWTGATDGNWDVVSGNWSDDGAPGVFFNGDAVTFPEGAANPIITIAPGTYVGDMTITADAPAFSFAGAGLAGSGALAKTGASTLAFSQTGNNAFPGGFSISGGTTSINTNQQATGTGPLKVTDTTLNGFGANAAFTATYANSSISLENSSWNFGGTSPGNVVHTYNFTGGEVGSTTASDPATAIQVANSALTLSSSNTTTKNFNGRIDWSGENTINRTSGNFTHTTNWNRAWYGGGTLTINKTGVATGRTMNFAGEGSTFDGTIILNNTQATGGNDPVFNLNASLPAQTFEVRNRWNLVNNTPGGLDATAAITLAGTASRLTLTQPVNNPAMAVDLNAARLVVGNAASTIGTLSADGAVIQASGDDSALTITESAGSVFSGTLAMKQANLLNVSATGIGIGEQTVGAITQNSGALLATFNAISPETATIEGAYTSNGGTLRILVQGVPPVDTPIPVLAYGSFSGTAPTVFIDGLGGDSRISATPAFSATGVTLTFSGAPETVVWSGNAGGAWDVNTTENWQLNGSPSRFFELDTARFDDTATGTSNVTLDADVNPGAILIDNTSRDYAFGGTATIIGAATLTKTGSGLVDLDLANTFSGGTVLNDGRLALGTDTAIGSGTLTANGGAISTIGTNPVQLANPVNLQGTLVVGDADDDGAITLNGTVSGTGGLLKAGNGTLTLASAADNTFSGGITVSQGTVSIATNTEATGTGALTMSPGTTLNSFNAANTITVTYGNDTIAIDQATWNFAGTSGGAVTHTYNFTGGEIGDNDAGNPATAIQLTDSTLNFSSTNTTTKAFNGRIHWSGNNTINRTSGGFTHTTNWNRAWYGGGTVTINKTGGATGRAMNFAGTGSTFNGTVILNNTQETGGNDPVFNLNENLPAQTFEVRNRWNLVNNTPGALDGATSITIADAASRLTLTQPITNPALDLEIGNSGIVNLGGNTSTVKTLTVNGVAIAAGTYTEAESFLNGDGELVVLEGEGSASPFQDWLTAAGLTPGAPGTGPFENFDGSGVANIVQFALGGNPADPSKNGTSIVFDAGDGVVGGPFVLTLAVRQGATFAGTPSPTATRDGVSYVIQGSGDLATWSTTAEEVVPAFTADGAVTAPAGYELRSFRLAAPLPADGSGFLRVVVDMP